MDKYIPSNPPVDTLTARPVWDELYRISQAINDSASGGSSNLDGGTRTSVYTSEQYVDGGSV